jgi:arylformamidase
MKIFDISMKIHSGMPVYAGIASKKPVFKTDSDYSSGTVYETRLEMNLHTGTHMDAPLHMLQGGGTIDELDLEKVITKCRVIDLKAAEDKVSMADLMGKGIKQGYFILLKTKNSYMDILEGQFIYLDEEGAWYLKDIGIKGVGIDALGIERGQPGHGTHKMLFIAGIVILEGLRLGEIEEGEYLLAAAPVNIEGAEAAPVRAALIEL